MISSLLKYNFNKNNLKVLLSEEPSYRRKQLNLKYECFFCNLICLNLQNFSEHPRDKLKFMIVQYALQNKLKIKIRQPKTFGKVIQITIYPND